MHEKLRKNARGRAKDPIQEQLRSHKDEFNDLVSLLIAKHIAFKRGINGAGDDRAGIPASKLTNPLPEEELRIYLNSILSDTQAASQMANNIINEQRDYAEKKNASVHPQLTAEASSALSRAWARISLLGHPDKGVRINILNDVSGLIADFYDLENELTSSKDLERLPRAIFKYTSILTHVGGSLGYLIESLLEKKTDNELAEEALRQEYEKESPTKVEKIKSKKTETVYKEDAPFVIDPSNLLADLDNLKVEITDLASRAELILQKYPNDAPDLRKDVKELSRQEVALNAMIAEDPEGLVLKHEAGIRDLKNSVNRINSQFKRFKIDVPNIAPDLSTMTHAAAELEEFRKLAHNAVSRWINRKLLEMSKDNLSSIVLRATNSIIEFRKDLEKIMDLVEDKKSTRTQIIKAYQQLHTPANEAAQALGKLGAIYIAKKKGSGASGMHNLSKTDLSDLNKALISMRFSSDKK